MSQIYSQIVDKFGCKFFKAFVENQELRYERANDQKVDVDERERVLKVYDNGFGFN